MSSTVGVYLDLDRVYVAECRYTTGAYQLSRSAVQSIDQRDFQNSASYPVLAAVRTAFQQAGIRQNTVDVCISDTECFVRYFEMPLLPSKEWKNAVRFEAQKYLPFEISDLLYDYKVTADKAKKRMRVMFLASKRTTINAITETLRQSGLKIRSLEPAPISRLRLFFSTQKEPAKEVFALLNLDDKGRLDMITVQGSMILITRHCEIAKDENGAWSFQSLLSEVRVSLSYFSKNFKNLTVGQLIFCADTDKTYFQWDRQLLNELEMPVETLNPVKQPGITPSYSSGLVAAMGVAVKSVANIKALSYNLVSADNLPGTVATAVVKEETAYLNKFVAIGLAVVAGSLLSLHLLLTGLLTAKANANKALLSGPLQEIVAVFTREQLQSRISELTLKYNATKSLIEGRVFITEKLTELARLTPKDIQLSAVYSEDAEEKAGQHSLTFSLEGFVLSDPNEELVTVNRYVATLKSSAKFMQGLSDIKIVSIQRIAGREKESTRFNLMCLAIPIVPSAGQAVR